MVFSTSEQAQKHFSTLQVNILTTLFLQGRVYVNGPSLNHLHALYAFKLNFSKISSPAASRTYLKDGRYTWRHNSVLLHLAKTFTSFSNCLLYADLPSFLTTSDSLRPDLVLITKNSALYIMELSLGFESNMQINSNRKAIKYKTLIADLSSTYSAIKFANLSMSALGILGSSSESFLSMFKDFHLDQNHQNYTTKKVVSIAIKCKYYVFCNRNKS